MTQVRWQVDDRGPTLWTRVYVAGMWLARDKSAFEGERHALRAARERQREGDRPPTRWTRRRYAVLDDTVDGTRVWRARPRRGAPRVRVLYLHGGGYLHPLTADYWRLVRALVSTGAEVVVPAYPLAPEHTVDDVLPWLARVERATRSSVPTVLMGDSAGGALALVLARSLRGVAPAPARVVLLSSWLDATLDDPEVGELEPTDPMLAESGLRAAGRWWSGDRDPADPDVSPVEGDLGGLPFIEVFVGDRDILRPAVDRLVDGVAAAGGGVRVRVREVTAMFHVWMTRAIPEGRRTRRDLARLVAAVGTARHG